jgi:hypothetical protein
VFDMLNNKAYHVELRCSLVGGFGVNLVRINDQEVEVNVDNHEWEVVFLPHCIESPNFAGLFCELLRYLSSTTMSAREYTLVCLAYA